MRLRLFKKKSKELVPGTIIKCESGRYVAYYEHRTDIIAHGQTELEVRKNLKTMYEVVKNYEASEVPKLSSTYNAKRFTEKLNRV